MYYKKHASVAARVLGRTDILQRQPVRMALAWRDFALGEWLHWSVHTGSLWPLLVDIRIFVSKINPFVFKSSGCRSTEMNAMHDVFK